jgi:hypothetical protein
MNTKRSKLYIGMLLIMTTISMQDLYAQAIEINDFYGW